VPGQHRVALPAGKGEITMNRVDTLFNQTSVIKFSKLVIAFITLGAAVWLAACRSDPVVEGKAFFTSKGCIECHSVSAFGVESKSNAGPDLTFAVEDAPKRFGKSLDDFWSQPSGTMQMVLTQKIKLEVDDKDKALELIKAAYERRPAQKAQK
jgi:hypothetical protein